jgi:hypothetical protein
MIETTIGLWSRIAVFVKQIILIFFVNVSDTQSFLTYFLFYLLQQRTVQAMNILLINSTLLLIWVQQILNLMITITI